MNENGGEFPSKNDDKKRDSFARLSVQNEHVSAHARVAIRRGIDNRKRGKKLKEKRRKEKMRRLQQKDGDNVDVSQFMGVDYEDSVFIPDQAENGSSELKREESVVSEDICEW